MILLNEREYVANILSTGNLGAQPLSALRSIAEYYCAEGYRRADIEQRIISVALSSGAVYDTPRFREAMAQIAAKAGKRGLIAIDRIEVTEGDVAVCDQLQRAQLRRLLFTLIVLARHANARKPNNNGWVNRASKEIFALANIQTTVKNQSLMLGELGDRMLAAFPARTDNTNIKVLALSDNTRTALTITDMRNIGYQYERLKGGTFIECVSCGLVVRRRGANHKYCKVCGETNALRTHKSLLKK